jgi:hypothetical protein
MSGRKTWALTVLAWGFMATLAEANPMAFLRNWSVWVAESRFQEGASPTANPIFAATPPPLVPPPAPTPITPAPVFMTNAASSPQPQTTPRLDAYLNFGTSAYPEQSTLTLGTAQPWYDSGSVQKAFGHVPTADEQQSFISAVVADVHHTLEASGLNGSNEITLTTDPSVGARHTLSVVSGLSYGANPNAIGITDVGGSGFGFIDKLNYANNPQDLEWAVAHNVTHELMHAFGVAVHHDTTGNYLDAATAKWSLLVDPNATLSAATVSDITASELGRGGNGSSGWAGGQQLEGDQELLETVPEPATIALWSFAATALLLHGRRLAGRRPG